MGQALQSWKGCLSGGRNGCEMCTEPLALAALQEEPLDPSFPEHTRLASITAQALDGYNLHGCCLSPFFPSRHQPKQNTCRQLGEAGGMAVRFALLQASLPASRCAEKGQGSPAQELTGCQLSTISAD